MAAETMRDDAIHTTSSTRHVLLSGVLGSLLAAAALVRLGFGSLDDSLASIAGALGGAILVPTGVAQLAARRLWPAPRRLSPLLLHAVVVPWAVTLASAAAILAGSSWALAAVRGLAIPSASCASYEDLIAARWSRPARGGAALVATLSDGRSIQFNLEAGEPRCRVISPHSRR